MIDKPLCSLFHTACIDQNDPPEEVYEITAGPETMKLKFKRNEDAST